MLPDRAGPTSRLSRDGRARCPLGVPRRGRYRVCGHPAHGPARHSARGAPPSARARPARAHGAGPRRPGDPGRGPGGRADLPARQPGDARHPRRRGGDRPDRSGGRRAPERAAPAREAGRPVCCGGHTGLVRRARPERDAAIHRSPAAGGLELSAHPVRDRRRDERRQLHRRRRWPGGGGLHDRRGHLRDHRALAGPR